MDPQIAELKELVRQNTKLVQETHDMVRGMHRSARMSAFFKLLYWVAILALLYYFYVYYLGPLIVHLQSVLQGLQQGGAQAQNANGELQGLLSGFSNTLGKFAPGSGSASAQ